MYTVPDLLSLAERVDALEEERGELLAQRLAALHPELGRAGQALRRLPAPAAVRAWLLRGLVDAFSGFCC